jgi:proteasome lid subunit RPN8/RPN11
VYYAEGQVDKAFVLYNKFVTLFVEKLPKEYPDYNKPEFKVDRAKIKKLVMEAFPRAEQLKKQLLSRFEAEKNALEEKLAEEAEKGRQEEEEKRAAEEREREERERRVQEEAERREREEAERVAAFLATGGSGAVSDSSRDAVQSDGVGSNQTPSTATHSSGVLTESGERTSNEDQTPSWTETAPTDDLAASMGGLTLVESPTTHAVSEERSVTATNAQLAQVLPPTYQGPPPPTHNLSPMTPPGGNLTPPAQVPLASARTYRSIFSGPSGPPPVQMAPPVYSEHPPPTNPYYQSTGGQGTQIPPPAAAMQYNQPGYYHQGYQPAPPPRGQYVTQYSNASSSSWGSVELPAPSYHMTPHTTPPTQTIREEEDEEPQVPNFDRSKKPSYNPLSTSIGGGYRMVYVPESISRKFEEAASANTRLNVETCAILAGKLSRNQLHVTHVILPKQKGGPDSCETISEEELFDVQDQHDLITLGWIHTHPSQTAFMSSVDLHTHCSYQIMMDEAVAIVCAPRYGQVGVYMLTEPYGLDYITHCEEEGFHTHPKEPPLYEVREGTKIHTFTHVHLTAHCLELVLIHCCAKQYQNAISSLLKLF